MASYGRTYRSRAPKAVPVPPAGEGEVLIAIHGRHTLEQLARELAIAVERLRDAGAYGVEKFRIRLEPRDEDGQPVILRDGAGKPISKIQIPEPPVELPYRPGPYDAPPPRPSPVAAPSAAVASFDRR